MHDVDESFSPSIPGITVIDIMIIYSPAARDNFGGTEEIESMIRGLMIDLNTKHRNSNTATRFRLVHTREVDYVSGGASLDISRMSGTVDGYLDEIHPLRGQYGADLVSLIVDLPGAGGGAAHTPGPYSVLDMTHIGAFTHEIGHCQGMRHAVGDLGVPHAAPATYNYGNRFYGASGVLYRTIMAYAPGISISYFSSPDIEYQGNMTGSTGRNNVQTAEDNAPLLSSFRPCQIDCDYNLDAPIINVEDKYEHIELTLSRVDDTVLYKIYKNEDCSGEPMIEIDSLHYRDYDNLIGVPATYSARAYSFYSESNCTDPVSGVALEHPSECHVAHIDNGDGTCTAEFYPVSDGNIQYDRQFDSGEETFPDVWSSVRNAPSGNVKSEAGLTFLIGVEGYEGFWGSEDGLSIERAFLSFDTREIPDNVRIVDSKLQTVSSILHSPSRAALLKSFRDNPETLELEDYSRCGPEGRITPQDYLSELIRDGNNLQTLNQNGMENINLASFSDFCYRTVEDALDDITEPLERYVIKMSSSNHPTLDERPKLTVTYEPKRYYHSICRGMQCIQIEASEGEGLRQECSQDMECSHAECRKGVCEIVNGVGPDQCRIGMAC